MSTARHVPTGTYDGAELARPPAREGATDAARIPSLIGGRRVSRPQWHDLPAPCGTSSSAPLARSPCRLADTSAPPLNAPAPAPAAPAPAPAPAPVPVPAPVPAPATFNGYTPRPGGSVDKALRLLHQRGTPIGYAELAQHMGVEREDLLARMHKPLRAGAVVRLRTRVNGKLVCMLSLPGAGDQPAESAP